MQPRPLHIRLPRLPRLFCAALAATALLLCAAPLRAQSTEQVQTFRYDPAGRLTRVTYDGATTISLGYDANGNVTTQNVTPSPPVETSGGGGSSSSGLCFIATAAYGSPLDSHVQTLREFRDEHLRTNSPGRAFVAFYERTSPPIAAFIARHDSLRAMTRWLLAPVVFAVVHPKTALASALALIAAAIVWRRRRRHARAAVSRPAGAPAPS